MRTLSVHVTEVEKDDKGIYCYDNLSMVIMQAMRKLELYGHKFVNITDYYCKDFDKLKESIKTATKSYREISNESQDSLIVIGVEPSPIEFPEIESIANGYPDSERDDNVDEIIESMKDAMLRDCVIMEQLGFKHLKSLELDGFCIPYVYPNLVGLEVMKYFDSLKEEQQ